MKGEIELLWIIASILGATLWAASAVKLFTMEGSKPHQTTTIYAPSLEECKAAIDISNGTRWNTKEAIFLAMSIKEQCPYGEVYLKGVQE